MAINSSVKKRLDSLLGEQRTSTARYYYVRMNFPEGICEEDRSRILSNAARESGLVAGYLSLNRHASDYTLLLRKSGYRAGKEDWIYRIKLAFDKLFHPFGWWVTASPSIFPTPGQNLYFEIDKYIKSEARPFLIRFFSSVYEKSFDSQEQIDYFLSC